MFLWAACFRRAPEVSAVVLLCGREKAHASTAGGGALGPSSSQWSYVGFFMALWPLTPRRSHLLKVMTLATAQSLKRPLTWGLALILNQSCMMRWSGFRFCTVTDQRGHGLEDACPDLCKHALVTYFLSDSPSSMELDCCAYRQQAPWCALRRWLLGDPLLLQLLGQRDAHQRCQLMQHVLQSHALRQHYLLQSATHQRPVAARSGTGAHQITAGPHLEDAVCAAAECSGWSAGRRRPRCLP